MDTDELRQQIAAAVAEPLRAVAQACMSQAAEFSELADKGDEIAADWLAVSPLSVKDYVGAVRQAEQARGAAAALETTATAILSGLPHG